MEKLRVIILIVLYCTTLILAGCSNKVENSDLTMNTSQPTETEGTSEKNNVKAENIVNQFIRAIQTKNSEEIKNMVSPEGLVVIRAFSSGNGTRGKNIRNIYSKEEIANTFSFDIKDEEPINIYEAYKNISEELETADGKGGYNFKDNIIGGEYSPSTDDIIDICSELVGDGEKTKVYSINDEELVLTQSSLSSDLPIGVWAVFERNGDKYYYRAIIDLR